MLQHYLKLAIRHFRKNTSISFINLFGLAFGLAAALAVVLYVLEEFSYETFHEKADRIVRLNVEATIQGSTLKLGTAPNHAAPFLKERLPEIEEALRVFPHNFGESASVQVGDQTYAEPHLFWSDPNLLDVLSIDLVAGAPEGVLDRTNTVLLSSSIAEKYFGKENPIGKTIQIDSRYDLEVTGVFRDLPYNTHLPFDLIGSFQTIPLGKPERLSWGNASFYTFLLLHSGTDPEALETKINEAVKQDVPEDRQWFQLKVKPLLDIHLYSSDIVDNRVQYGSIAQIWVLLALAVILVLIACINYMNLATARSQQRSKEVAVSKTIGATSSHLVGQFFAETATITLGGLLLAFGILWLVQPLLTTIADRPLSFQYFLQPAFWGMMLAVWGILTLVAGSYPALYLSSFQPITILHKQRDHRKGAAWVRKGLVVFQFCVSISLIAGTIILYQQLNYIQNKELGYEPEQVIAIRVAGIQPNSAIGALEKELKKIPAIRSTALSQSYPGNSASGRSLSRMGAQEEESADLTSCRAYPDIFEVLDMNLIAGRPMKVLQEGDTITELVLNRSAVEFLQWTPEEAIGQKVEANLGTSLIVGVTEDFHYGPLRQEIGFYAFHNGNSEYLQFLMVKVNSEDLMQTMDQIKTTFRQVAPNAAFEYTFLDSKLESLYRSEKQLAQLVFVFAGIAIFIACLGLFALAAFATERRTKEIGIRKVLGASISHIVQLITKEFLVLIGIGFLLAGPLAWWSMQTWLQGFAYRIQLHWWVFLLAGLLATIIAVITIGFQSIKAALANPVEALKQE